MTSVQGTFWGAGSSHTIDIKNGSGLSLYGTHDEEGTTKHNWSAGFGIWSSVAILSTSVFYRIAE